MKKTITLFTALCLFITTATAQVVDVVTTGLTGPYGVTLSGNTLYIAEYGGNKISKIDISQPNPIPVDVATSGVPSPSSMFLDGNDLYIGLEIDGKVVKVDVTQPNPTPVDVVTGLIGTVQGVILEGNDLYIADVGIGLNNGRIIKIDISQPFPATIVEVVTGVSPAGMVKVGDVIYYTGGFWSNTVSKVDISEPNPIPEVLVNTGLNSPVGLTLNGQFIYVAQYNGNKISKIDLNAPTPMAADVVTGLSHPGYCAFDGVDLYFPQEGSNKISKLEIAQPSMSDLGTVCAGSTTTLGGASPTGGVYSGTGVTDNGNGETFTFDASVAGVGTTTVTYTAAGGSGLTATADVTVSLPLIASAVVDSNAYCFGFQDGGATASTTGGTAPYTYLWDNTATTASIQGVGAGTYSVMVTDANGCTSNASVTITEPAELTVAMSSTDDDGSGNGTATATPSGGASNNYTYSWNTVPVQTTATASGLAAGTYEVTVSNAQAPCTATETVVVNGGCIVNIPDANFKSYLVGNAAINTNSDGEIQCSEASAYAGSINCPIQSISNLTGIESFTALTELHCNYNQLTSLDVSQNTALTDLDCIGNQLTSLDVSQNTALTVLDCSGNQLTSLDVSQNLALFTLFCENNQISVLDVSANTSLATLWCNDNQLTSLNVANGNNSNFIEFYAQENSDLTCIQVDDANYSANNWTSISFEFDAGVNFSENCNSLPADNECDGANDINSLFGGVVNTPMTSSLYDNTGYTSNGDPTSGIECYSEGTASLEATIWYTFIGDGNTYRIRTVDCSATNPHSDTQASLYSGDCNTLTPVACNDDEDPGNDEFNAQLDIETVSGTEYFLMIDGFNGTEGEFCLEVTRQGASNIFEAEYQTVNVYPNPTEGILSWNGITAQTAELMDNTGRMVMNITQPNGTVDISNLKEGIYIMMLHTDKGVYTSRVVKQ